MGYKLAGCDVIGCVEIDKRMNEIYRKNHSPKYNYNIDIRDFNNIPNGELPEELFKLDILDGSPPCSVFSMAGERESGWGKNKKFREGQKLQTLDDLLFVFIETAKKLKPKVVIMENVEGLLLGNAFNYVKEIYKKFDVAGYNLNHFLMKSEEMGIPQRRHRVFFIAIRKDIDFDVYSLSFSFNYEKVLYKDVKSGKGMQNKDSQWYKILQSAKKPDGALSDTRKRIGMKDAQFNCMYCWEDEILPTITAKLEFYDPKEKTKLSGKSIVSAQTFPQDYDFMTDKDGGICYVCGMSVPPVMMKRIVETVIKSGVFCGVER